MKLCFKDGDLIPLEEGYIVWGKLTREQAIRKVRAYEKRELGLDKSEMTDPSWLNERWLKRIEFMPGGEDKYTFSETPTAYPCWFVLF